MTKEHKDKKSKPSKDKKPTPPPQANNIFLSLLRAASMQIKQPTATEAATPSAATNTTTTTSSAATFALASSTPTSTPPTQPSFVHPTTTITTTAAQPSTSTPLLQQANSTAPSATSQPLAPTTVVTSPPAPTSQASAPATTTHTSSSPALISTTPVPPSYHPAVSAGEDVVVQHTSAHPAPDVFTAVPSSQLAHVRSVLGYRRRPTAVDVTRFKEWVPEGGEGGGRGPYVSPTLFTMDLPFLVNATPQLPSTTALRLNVGDSVADAAARRLGANLRSILPPSHPLFNTIAPFSRSEALLADTTDAKLRKEATYTNAPHHYHTSGLKRERLGSTSDWVQHYINNKKANDHNADEAGITSPHEGEYLNPALESEYVTTPTDYTFMRSECFNISPFREVPTSLLGKCGVEMASESFNSSSGTAAPLPGNDDAFYRTQNSFVGTPEIATETTLRNDLLLAITERPQKQNSDDHHRNVYAEDESFNEGGIGVANVKCGDLLGRWVRRVDGVGASVPTTVTSVGDQLRSNRPTTSASSVSQTDTEYDKHDEEVFVPVSSRYATFLVPKTKNGDGVNDAALRQYAMSKLHSQSTDEHDGGGGNGLLQDVSFEGFSCSPTNTTEYGLHNSINTEGGDCSGEEDPYVRIIGVVKRHVALNTPAAFTFSQTAMELPQGRTLSYPPSSLLPSLVGGTQHILPYSYTPVYHVGSTEQVHKKNAYFDAPAPPLFQGEGGLLQQVLEGKITAEVAAEMGVCPVPATGVPSSASPTTSTTAKRAGNILIPIFVSVINCDEEVPSGLSTVQLEVVKRLGGTMVDAYQLHNIVSCTPPDSGVCLVQWISLLPEMKGHTRHGILKSLNTITYTFNNGPFRTTRFLFGVDPRNDPDRYAKYQQVSFRFVKYRTIATLMEGLDNLPFRAESALKASRDMAEEFIVRARAYLEETAPKAADGGDGGDGTSSSKNPSRGEKLARATTMSVRALREQSIQLLEDYLKKDPAAYITAIANRKSSLVNVIEGRAFSFPAAVADIFTGNRRAYSLRLIDAVSGNWQLTQALGEAIPHKKCTPTTFGYYTETFYRSLMATFESELTSFLQDRVVAASEEFVRGGGEIAVAAFLNQNTKSPVLSTSTTSGLPMRSVDDDNDGDSDINGEGDDNSLSSRLTSQAGGEGGVGDDDLDSIIDELEDVRAEDEYEGVDGGDLLDDADAEDDGSDGFEDFESYLLPPSQ